MLSHRKHFAPCSSYTTRKRLNLLRHASWRTFSDTPSVTWTSFTGKEPPVARGKRKQQGFLENHQCPVREHWSCSSEYCLEDHALFEIQHQAHSTCSSFQESYRVVCLTYAVEIGLSQKGPCQASGRFLPKNIHW